MAKAITEMVTLAVTVAFAIPVALLGVRFLSSDQPVLGVVFVGLAVLMVVVEEYITTPTDLPAVAAQRVAGTVVKTESKSEREKEQS